MTQDKWANLQQMWDERFSREEAVYGRRPNEFVREQAALLKSGMRVLVPADGYGRNGIWLAKQGLRVHAVDLSPVGVARARKVAEDVNAQITIECADLCAWNWPVETYDAVVVIFRHLPPEQRRQVLAAMVRSLKPGGLVIFEAFSHEQLNYTSGGPKQVDLLYSAELLRQDLTPCAALLLEEKVVELEEGHKHSGPAAVVRAVFKHP